MEPTGSYQDEQGQPMGYDGTELGIFSALTKAHVFLHCTLKTFPMSPFLQIIGYAKWVTRVVRVTESPEPEQIASFTIPRHGK